MGAVVGIDLGTTNTVVAAIRDGRPRALPDESGSTLIPSIVSFLPSGAVLVGSAAKERRSEDARNTIYSVKRLIGRTWDSNEVKEAKTRFPFELREGPGRATFVIARNETYTLPEISAFVLRKAKSIAELELGEPVDRAVITVPANFNDLQRAATKVAGRVAGLEVLRILNEPTAAALAFGHTRGNRERIAIYDFGGGTFDLTLLLLTDDVFEVLATAGDTFLGGDDIDAAIVERMLQRLPADLVRDLAARPETLERLRSAAEHVKVNLSESPVAQIHLDEHEVGGAGGLDFSLSRDELDRIVEPVVTRTFKVCHDALALAKLGPRDIDHVLLVGGTTLIPHVRAKVEAYFGRSARSDLDPHEVVALGAAQQAMALTQVRATASGIPMAPPPRRVLGSSSNEATPDVASPTATEDEPSRQKTARFGPLRKQTDPGVGDSEDSVQPGRVSVVPPEGPLSHPPATTQNFGSRDRRTTGVGIGPNPVEPAAAMREALAPTTPPSTISGLGELSAPYAPLATRTDLDDLPLPLVPAATQHPLTQDISPAVARREFSREPMVRVTRGTAPQPDLTATLSSVGNTSTPRNEDASNPSTDPLFGALVHASPVAPSESGPGTAPQFGARVDASPLAPSESGPGTEPLFGALVHASPETGPSTASLFGATVPQRGSSKVEPSPTTNPLYGKPHAGSPTLPLDAANVPSKSVRETLPDEAGAWDDANDDTGDVGLPIVTTSAHLTPERRVVTTVSQKSDPIVATVRKAVPTAPLDALADLPLVVAHPTGSLGQVSTKAKLAASTGIGAQPASAKAENSAAPRLGLPEPLADQPHNFDEDYDDDTGADEPTVVRRSLRTSSDLADAGPPISARYTDDLPELVTSEHFHEPPDLPAAVLLADTANAASESPNQSASKPSSLTEDEIRARYGNLPLIVGGKRVGPRTAESVPESGHAPGASTAQASKLRVDPRDIEFSRKTSPTAALRVDETSRVPATLTRRSQPPPVIVAPLPAPHRPAAKSIPSIEPDAMDLGSMDPSSIAFGSPEPEPIELEYIEPDFLEPAPPSSAPRSSSREPAAQDEAVPKSQRLHSTRPSARQNSAEEFELPIPELPPPRPIPKAAGPAIASTRPLSATAKAPVVVDPGVVRPDPFARPAQAPRTPAIDTYRGGAAAFNATVPLGAAGLRTDAWHPPSGGKATTEAGNPAFTPTQNFEVPSLLASLPKSQSIRPTLLIDVTPLSLCVETVGGYVDTLIARNTPVPCERTRDFVTAQDNQHSVIVRIAQGESKQFRENVVLGEVQLTGIPAAQRGQSRIAVTFGIDSDGILHVRALDVMSGQSALADLQLQGAPTSPEIAQMMVRHAAKSPG